jgi:hypothetical protein
MMANWAPKGVHSCKILQWCKTDLKRVITYSEQ